jgi:hypothetical protein
MGLRHRVLLKPALVRSDKSVGQSEGCPVALLPANIRLILDVHDIFCIYGILSFPAGSLMPT